MAREGQMEAESPLESAGTHQRKRHHKVRRTGGLFTPPYVLIDIHTPPKNTHTSMLWYGCIHTPTHTHTHTHTQYICTNDHMSARGARGHMIPTRQTLLLKHASALTKCLDAVSSMEGNVKNVTFETKIAKGLVVILHSQLYEGM